jgi:triosephosphate isomerase
VNEPARRPLCAGNWKLYKTQAEARALIEGLRRSLATDLSVEVVVAPPFTALCAAAEALAGSPIKLAAQDVHWETQGAFTGEVSAAMLADAGCSYVIVGHSERRQLFHESDLDVQRKAAAVARSGMAPIVCVGESLAQREAGETESHVLRQVELALAELKDEDALASVVLAYEPIWAIGTGRTAAPTDAQQVHAAIRGRLDERYGPALAHRMRILYGGSVKPDNAQALMAEPDIDGALVGGASLEEESFGAIVRASSPKG